MGARRAAEEHGVSKCSLGFLEVGSVGKWLTAIMGIITRPC